MDRQTGFIALINGKVTGLEALSRPTAFTKAWPKLVRSYALDAIDMRMTGENSSIPPLEKGGARGDLILPSPLPPGSPPSTRRACPSINPADWETTSGETKDLPWVSCSNIRRRVIPW